MFLIQQVMKNYIENLNMIFIGFKKAYYEILESWIDESSSERICISIILIL